MDKINKSHAQVPNKTSEKLKFGDKLVYANIRKRITKERMYCWPGLDTIAEECDMAVKTVKACIQRLEDAGFMKVERKKGASWTFTFEKLEDGFERFSKTFLENENISAKAKAYYIELQQHLILDEENGTHNTTYTNKQISDMLGISLNSVKKYNTELIQHDILHETTLLTRTDGGFNLVKKSFDLEKLGQVILLKVKEHEEKLNKHEKEIADLKQIVENNEVEKEVLFRRITALERIVGLQNNTYIEKFSTTL